MSQQLPAWVDFIFGKLRIRYGEAFERVYGGLDWSIVKGDWIEVLEGVSGETIKAAINQLPADRPPNALQFRAICRSLQLPAREYAALPPPDVKSDPDRVRSILAGLRAKLPPNELPALRCAANLRRIATENGGLSLRQAEVLAACEHVCGDTSQLAA